MRRKQSEFSFPNTWGGRRKGAGPKPKGKRPGVSHRTRAPLASRFPVLVTVKLRAGLPNLRRRREYEVLWGAMDSAKVKNGFRLVHFSVQGDHVHFLMEGTDRQRFSRGVQGLLIRIAKRLNKLWDRRGRIFEGRHHDRILRSPREVRAALRYVLNNARKHGSFFGRLPDPFSSGRWFDGWKDLAAKWNPGAPVVRAGTWLLEVGWRKCRLIRVGEVPGS